MYIWKLFYCIFPLHICLKFCTTSKKFMAENVDIKFIVIQYMDQYFVNNI